MSPWSYPAELLGGIAAGLLRFRCGVTSFGRRTSRKRRHHGEQNGDVLNPNCDTATDPRGKLRRTHDQNNNGGTLVSLTSGPPVWSSGLRLLHWLTALIVAWALVVAFSVMGPGLSTMVWMPLHASLGFAVLLLVFLRVIWRLFARRASSGRGLMRVVAGAVQAGLYATLVAVVVTGWIAYRPMPLMPPVRLAGMFDLPVFPEGWIPPLAYVPLHRTLTWVFLALLAIHLVAAAMHIAQRDGVMSTMLWRRRKHPREHAEGAPKS